MESIRTELFHYSVSCNRARSIVMKRRVNRVQKPLTIPQAGVLGERIIRMSTSVSPSTTGKKGGDAFETRAKTDCNPRSIASYRVKREETRLVLRFRACCSLLYLTPTITTSTLVTLKLYVIIEVETFFGISDDESFHSNNHVIAPSPAYTDAVAPLAFQ